MTHDRKNQAQANLKGSIFCFLCAVMIWAVVVATTNPNGTFSYIRFSAVLLCWLLFLLGATLAFLAMRRLERSPARLLAVVLMTLHCVGSLLGAGFLVAGIGFLKLEHDYKRQAAADLTNATLLAWVEFRSNNSLYKARYFSASEGLRSNLQDNPAPILKSKEFFETRGTNFANVFAAGTTYAKFFQSGPSNFTREVENSGESPNAIKDTLRQFQRRELKLWDEQYAVVEKTLQVTSNTIVLNDLLLSNFDQWHISNGTIVLDAKDLTTKYFETVTKLKKYKGELDKASDLLNERQHAAPEAPTNSITQ